MVRTVLQRVKEKKQASVLEEQGGKGTIWLSSWEAFDKVTEQFQGKMISPGGAAGRLGVSRARIHQLEAEGAIRAYRVRLPLDLEDYLVGFPCWAKLLIRMRPPKHDLYIFIPVADLDAYRDKVRGRRKKKKIGQRERSAK